jgi:alkanesulfonate monooxygenase
MHVEFTSLFEPDRSLGRADHFPTAELLRHAALLEDNEIDRLQVAPGATGNFAPTSFVVIENAPLLGVTLAHRAGEWSPEEAAEQFGLLDQLTSGRLAISVQPPANALFEEKHDARASVLSSFDEYLTLLKRLWAAGEPFDFEGAHHRVTDAHVASKPFNRSHVPLILAGAAGTVAVKHADVVRIDAAPIPRLRRNVAELRTEAANFGRSDRVGFQVEVRPIVGETREAAWQSAAVQASSDLARETAIRLVGTAEQVAVQFIALVDLGIGNFLVRGLQEEGQLAIFGSEVAPLVRNAAARQTRRRIGHLMAGVGDLGIYPG